MGGLFNGIIRERGFRGDHGGHLSGVFRVAAIAIGAVGVADAVIGRGRIAVRGGSDIINGKWHIGDRPSWTREGQEDRARREAMKESQSQGRNDTRYWRDVKDEPRHSKQETSQSAALKISDSVPLSDSDLAAVKAGDETRSNTRTAASSPENQQTMARPESLPQDQANSTAKVKPDAVPASMPQTTAETKPAAKADTAAATKAETAAPFDLTKLASGTPVTTKLINQIELAVQTGQVQRQTFGQGLEARDIFLKDGKVIGGLSRNERGQTEEFITREKIDSQLAASGKTVAGIETGLQAMQGKTMAAQAETTAAATPAASVSTPKPVISNPGII